jgi:hypothetical protein
MSVAVETSRQSAWLSRLARALEPERLPFYVRTPEEPGVLVGWYWQPAGAPEPQPLGSNARSSASVPRRACERRLGRGEGPGRPRLPR